MDYQFNPSKTFDNLLHSILNFALISVKAPAGSIMMLDSSKKELHIRGRLGPPRHDRIDEPVFKIRDGGIASKVIQECKPYITGNVKIDRNFLSTRPGEPVFKSLISVPIKLENKVFGAINADHEKEDYFSKKDLVKLETFADKMAPFFVERISVPEALKKITSELTRETQEGNINTVLRLIADNIRHALGAKNVILYQYDHELKKFVRNSDEGPTRSGELEHPEYMKNPVFKTDVPFQILKNEKPVYITSVDENEDNPLDLCSKIIRKGEEHPDRERFFKRENIQSLAALPLIFTDNNNQKKFVGVLFVNYSSMHNFNIEEKNALEAFAEAAALAILNARREDRNRMEKTGLFYRINKQKNFLLLDDNFVKNFRDCESETFVLALDIRRSTELMLNATSKRKYAKFICELEKNMKDSVLRNNGIVDKFTGDGLIAHFPIFYSGKNAGRHCLACATECHAIFKQVYEENSSCFQVVLADIGLGIGIDFGNVYFTIEDQELIAVGPPVVFSCRLSSVDGGCTVLNEQAVVFLKKNNPELKIKTMPVEICLKHQGNCQAMKVFANK